ncbi:hypothetical protein BsWGS_23106 [Bradybaena similaris]
MASLLIICSILLSLHQAAGVGLGLDQAAGAGLGQALSKSVLTVLSLFNGKFSNCDQKNDGVQGHAFLQVRIIPLNLPNLSQFPMVFVEQATNGKVNIQQLCSVSVDNDGRIILKPHNITANPHSLKYEEYDISSLSSLKPNDINTTEGCEAVFQPFVAGTFIITWPDCSHVVNGEHPAFSIVISCGTMKVIMPAGGSILTTKVPYKLDRSGDR